MVQRFKNILIIIAVIAVTFIMIKNKYADYDAQKNNIESDRTGLEKKKLLAKVGDSVAREYDETIKNFSFKDEEEFKKFVGDEAGEHNVVVDSFRPAKTDKGVYLEIKIEIVSPSPYKNVADFVKALEGQNIEILKLEIKNISENARQALIAVRGIIPKV